VIFLDHMMPGMDGFETLTAVKGNARTAAIPVVMYTSREGDAYMGQALQLGAIGVLQKPVKPEELAQILERVDRLRSQQAATATAARLAAGPAPGRPSAAVTGVIHVPPEFRNRRAGVPPAEKQAAAGNVTEKAVRSLPWGFYLKRLLIALALLLPAVWLLERYQATQRQLEQAQRQNRELRAQEEATRLVNTQLAILPTALEGPLRAEPVASGLLDTLAWALNQHSQYGFQEEPLGDARLAQMRELVARLAAAGFTGTIRLETHVGEFCLVRDERGEYRMPSDSLPIGRCEIVTHPHSQAVASGQRQSAAFARYLAERRPSNRIQVAVLSHGAHRPLVAYPDSTTMQTASDWNQIARLNQRVEVVLVPTP